MRLRALASLGFGIAWVVACSAASSGSGSGVSGGSGGTSGGGSSSGGASGTGGFNNTGGTGAFNGTGGSNSGGSGGLGPDASCVSIGATADSTGLPVDIILAVDSSGSMNLESKWVQQNMAPFSQQITSAGIDVHVVLISAPSTSGNGICVPAPLGSGNCPDDSQPPFYLHVPVGVASNDALDKYVSTYPQWSSMLRPGALKYFVVVTDDNATDGPYNSAAAFEGWVNTVDPSLFTPGNWKFDGIFASAPPWVNPCLLISAATGTVYKDLVQQTGGIWGDLCLQSFGPVFNQLATGVKSDAKVSCVYAVPAAPDGGTLDPGKVNVNYLPGGNPPVTQILRVDKKADCPPSGSPGFFWYFDNNANPTTIFLCGGTCSAVDTDPNAKIDVEFGCASVYKPPA